MKKARGLFHWKFVFILLSVCSWWRENGSLFWKRNLPGRIPTVESFSLAPKTTRTCPRAQYCSHTAFGMKRRISTTRFAMKSTSSLPTASEQDTKEREVPNMTKTRILTRKQRIFLPSNFHSVRRSSSSSSQSDNSKGELLVTEWLNFCWKQGGGLPWLPPIILYDSRKHDTLLSSPENDDNIQMRRWIVPFLLECVTSVQSENGTIHYRVENPGIFTYPVQDHQGTVQFVKQPNDDDDGWYDLIWQVQVVPFTVVDFQPWQWWVEWLTEAVITTMSRNYAIHVLTPNATVAVAPPRGKGNPFARVPAETWLGGVLDAHLHDSRSTFEQTLSIFQPWTWGRCRDESDSGACTEWTDGFWQN